MVPDDIATVPGGERAAADSQLHLWVPHVFLFEAKDVLEAEGCTEKSVFMWVKPSQGLGNY